MWLFIVIFVLFILWLYKLTSPSARLREYGDKIPGPKSLPFIGTAYVFFTSKRKYDADFVLYVFNIYLYCGKGIIVGMR